MEIKQTINILINNNLNFSFYFCLSLQLSSTLACYYPLERELGIFIFFFFKKLYLSIVRSKYINN